MPSSAHPTMPPPEHVLQLAAAGCASILRTLLATQASLAFCSDNRGRTPLHVAAAEGHTHVVRLLLSAGAAHDAVDAHGRTPADDARIAGRIDTLRVLAAADAATAPLEARLRPGHAPARELFAAAAAGDVRAATVAVAAFGAHVNASNCDGRTPLHTAVAAGHVNIASYLIATGADPARRDRWGRTPALEAECAPDPAMRALFEGVRAAAPVKAAAAAAASIAAEAAATPSSSASDTPQRRRAGSLPRITRVASNSSVRTSDENTADQSSNAAEIIVVSSHNKRHSAPHIVKVRQESSAATVSSPVQLTSRTEQTKLLESSFIKAEQLRQASLAEQHAIRTLESEVTRVHVVEVTKTSNGRRAANGHSVSNAGSGPHDETPAMVRDSASNVTQVAVGVADVAAMSVSPHHVVSTQERAMDTLGNGHGKTEAHQPRQLSRTDERTKMKEEQTPISTQQQTQPQQTIQQGVQTPKAQSVHAVVAKPVGQPLAHSVAHNVAPPSPSPPLASVALVSGTAIN